MKKPQKLIHRLAYDFLIIGLLPLLFMGIGLFFILSNSLDRVISSKNIDLLSSFGRELQVFQKDILSSIDEVRLLTSEGIISEKELPRYLHLLVERNPVISMIQVLDQDYRVKHVAPPDESQEGLDFSRHPYILDARRELAYSWSRTFISPDTGKTTVTVTHIGSNFSLVFFLDLEVLEGYTGNPENSDKGYRFILDQNGTFISHPDTSVVYRRENLRNYSQVRELIDHPELLKKTGEIETDLLYLQVLHPSGWILGYRQSRFEAYRIIRIYRWVSLFFSLFMMLLATLLANWQLRDTVNPLLALIEAIDLVEGGEYRLNIESGHIKEVAQLNNRFVEMIHTVGDREKELRDLRNYLSNIIDSMPSEMIVYDREYRITLWNKQAENITGISHLQAVGQSLFQCYPDLEKVRNILVESLSGPGAQSLKLARHKEKGDRELTVFPLPGADGPQGAVLRIDNVTERVQLEERILQSEKLNTVGKLAAGMAHDLNNLITPILGFSELLQMYFVKNEEAEGYLREIIDASLRSKDLVQQLLTFSKKQALVYKEVDINQLIRNFENLLRRSIEKQISFSIHLADGSIPVSADKGQIEQVLLNLCVNARDALPKGGRIILETALVHFERSPEQELLELPPGEYCRITVEDNGQGMTQEVLNHIFEPFYSTKENMGTGLGLATVYAIIKQHQGEINVSSEPGKGSRFLIYLPVLPPAGSPDH